ncbi:unnamed protein product [Lathyrus sativus]|nr:unnamed protein product [Lathyrus sativus]
MPLIEITNAHLLRAPLPYYYHVKHSQFSASHWNVFRKRNFNVPRPRLPFLIQAVAATIVQPISNDTIVEPKSKDIETAAIIVEPKSNETEIGGHNHQPDPGIMLDEEPVIKESERLRRLRISKSNKGKAPWNKGRKHPPETLRKIKERTLIAMQNPKVKMKLVNLGRTQSADSRHRISLGVRKLWDKRRRMKILQDTCCSQWQNLIAQASRQGFLGQEELQWNSYETLDAQLKQESLRNAELRKLMTRESSSKRGPKSPEQRKKIAASITAKWANPDYREKVLSAMAKRHLSTGKISTQKKPRPRPYSAQTPKTKRPITKKDSDNSTLVKSSSKIVKPIKLRKIKSPAYKDPLVNSKLEMIKNIRAQRVSVDTRQTQAIQQARLLIAEAEKAAKALEVAAATSPIARSSLIETRKLIAEAIQSLESIDTQKTIQSLESIDTQKTDDCNVPSEVNKENESTFEVGNHSQMTRVVNRHTTLSSSVYKLSEDFGYLSLGMPVNNGDPELHLTNGCAFLPFSLNSQINQYRSSNQEKETEQYESSENESQAEDETLSRSESPTEDETQSRSRSSIVTKKWVRGRLVEVSEEQQ